MSLKILFVTSNEPNQGDIYFKGLKTILGDRIIEYPYKPLLHLSYEGERLVGRSLDGNIVIEENNFGELINRKDQWRVPKYFGYINSEKYPYGANELPDLSEFDVVVVNFLRSNKYVVKKILSNSDLKKPLFFLDGEDDPFVRAIILFKVVKKYFKREFLSSPFVDKYYFLRWSRFYLSSHIKSSFDVDSLLFPSIIRVPKLEQLSLTVGSLNPFKIPKNKIYDISFIAFPSNPLRVKLYSFLKSYAKKNKLKALLLLMDKHSSLIGGNLRVVPHEKYAKIIANSKLSFAVQGAGFDTYRYWEIPFYGSTLVSQKPYIFIENNFVDDESAIFFRNFEELERKLDYYLLKDKWETICKNGQIHFLKYHTYIHRAIKILRVIEKFFK